jgi:hypothetical protein
MASRCRREAAGWILSEAKQFCDQKPPDTREELSHRQMQASHLTSRIASVSHADLMARSHPGVSDEILTEARSFLDRLGLDDPPYNESLLLTTKVSELCFSDMAQRAQ